MPKFSPKSATRQGQLRNIPCARTPCAAALDIGPHELLIRSLADATHYEVLNADVPEEGNHVLRAALGQHHTPNGAWLTGLIATVIAPTVGMAGGTGLIISHGRFTPLNDALLISGGVLLVGGIIMMIMNRAVQQQGSSSEFELPPTAIEAAAP